MALFDTPPDSAHLDTLASTTDSGCGVTLTYTSAQASIPCIAAELSGSEQARFAQAQIVATHKFSFLNSVFTTTPARGMKLVSGSESYHITGILTHLAIGSLPALTEIVAERLL